MDTSTIYLTFDDGIQEGTSEVIDVLTELGIKATFFLVGINSGYFYKKNAHLFTKTLSRIVQDHEIGNHSFSHSNGFFDEYYSTGLLVNNLGKTIPVVEDFVNNEQFFEERLKETALDLSSVRSFISIARLPGRNSWFYTRPVNGAANNDNSKVNLIVNCEADSYKDSLSLFKKGYNVIGWDEEWFMSYELHKEAKAACKLKMQSQEDVMECISGSFPYGDMLSAENVLKDRVVEDHEAVFERIMAKRKKNTVLLMHDRAFRSDHDSNAACNKLYKLLTMLKRQQFAFGTISNLLMHD